MPHEGSLRDRADVILTPDQRVRVFISSTLGERAAERAAARRAITGLHLGYVGRPDELRGAILKELALEEESEQPVGKIARIPAGKNTYLLLAVADRHEQTRSTVAVDAVWSSLSQLWQYARLNNMTSRCARLSAAPGTARDHPAGPGARPGPRVGTGALQLSPCHRRRCWPSLACNDEAVLVGSRARQPRLKRYRGA